MARGPQKKGRGSAETEVFFAYEQNDFCWHGPYRVLLFWSVLWILCDTLARWLQAVSSTLVVMVTRARKLPGRQEVLPCCGEDVVDIEHWRVGGQDAHR